MDPHSRADGFAPSELVDQQSFSKPKRLRLRLPPTGSSHAGLDISQCRAARVSLTDRIWRLRLLGGCSYTAGPALLGWLLQQRTPRHLTLDLLRGAEGLLRATAAEPPLQREVRGCV